MILTFKLVTTLADAQRVRMIRNECCRFMTNHQQTITSRQQREWFRKVYPCSHSYLYLYFYGRQCVGYGALRNDGDCLWVTEAVRKSYRGKGIGKAILSSLKQRSTPTPLRAEIWSYNTPSLVLHLKSGFELVSMREHKGKMLAILSFTHVTTRKLRS